MTSAQRVRGDWALAHRSTIVLTECDSQGERGLENSKNSQTSFMYGPSRRRGLSIARNHTVSCQGYFCFVIMISGNQMTFTMW